MERWSMGVDQPQCGAGRTSGKREAAPKAAEMSWRGPQGSQEPTGKSPRHAFSNPLSPLAVTSTPHPQDGAQDTSTRAPAGIQSDWPQ